MNKTIQRLLPSIVIYTIAGWLVYYELQQMDYFYQWRVANAIQGDFYRMMGVWGIRLLLLSLLITPLLTLTRWRGLTRLRQPLGLAAFGFMAIHVYIYALEKYTAWQMYPDYDLYTRIFHAPFVIFGMIAFGILTLLAITSFKPIMKLMGRFWKPLHRLVYISGILIMLHVILATLYGKRAGFGGTEARAEYQLYLVALVVLLVMRIPIIKRCIQWISSLVRNPRKRKAKRSMQLSS